MPTKTTEKFSKGTVFCDLDGTIFDHGTGDLLPGARDFLKLCESYDIEVVFVTRRGDKEFATHPAYSRAAAREHLERHGLQDHRILFDVMSPRFLVDDSAIAAIPRPSGQGFTADELENIETFFHTMT